MVHKRIVFFQTAPHTLTSKSDQMLERLADIECGIYLRALGVRSLLNLVITFVCKTDAE